MSESADTSKDACFRVELSMMADGERFPFVIDRRAGLPVHGTTQWCLFIRRPKVQANTLAEDMRALAHLYDWALRQHIALEERLSAGTGLSPTELVMLYDNLRFVRPDGRKIAAGKLQDVSKMQPVQSNTHSIRASAGSQNRTPVGS
jgi:hypothetical protein